MLPHFLLVISARISFPPGGVQLAYARKGARDDTGIAFVRGGLCLENISFDTPSSRIWWWWNDCDGPSYRNEI